MGLKTASTAHCKKLAVVSRNKKGAEPLRITMDLDNYANWECELDSPEPHEVAWLDQVAKNKSGTIVIWKSVMGTKIMPIRPVSMPLKILNP